jgi:hypothetical protein
MSVLIKQLGAGSVAQNTTDSPLLTTNPVDSGKAVIVKSIRLVNTSATNSVTVNLNVYAGATLANRRIAPMDLTLAAKAMYVDDDEITLEAGNKLLLSVAAGSGGPVEYVVSGVMRDQ